MPLPIFDLEEIQVATPCAMKWQDMKGDDRQRFCGSCNKNVFNLSGMGRSEAIDFIRAAEGPVCVRFYKRADGTVLTSDCPVGLARVARRAKRLALGTFASSLGAIAALLAVLAVPTSKVCELQRRVEVTVDALLVKERPDAEIAGAMR